MTMKILMVDNAPEGNRLLIDSLQSAGHTIFIMKDGMKALFFLDGRETADIIISGIDTLAINGFTFLMMVRSHPRYASVPFIVHTSTHPYPFHEALAMDLGATAFVRKSNDNAEILRSVLTLSGVAGM